MTGMSGPRRGYRIFLSATPTVSVDVKRHFNQHGRSGAGVFIFVCSDNKTQKMLAKYTNHEKSNNGCAGHRISG